MNDPAEKIVRMANQIATFFKSSGESHAVAGTQNHIAQFWDPRMRAQLRAHLESGGAGLDPVALEAAGRLAAGSTASGKT
jgi:formate dehydrogenase subunit delta